MGFDPSGKFLLTVSHSGRGVFAVDTWQRIARDSTVLYPTNGAILGIGPLAATQVGVIERSEKVEQIVLRSLDGRFELLGESDGITIRSVGA